MASCILGCRRQVAWRIHLNGASTSLRILTSTSRWSLVPVTCKFKTRWSEGAIKPYAVAHPYDAFVKLFRSSLPLSDLRICLILRKGTYLQEAKWLGATEPDENANLVKQLHGPCNFLLPNCDKTYCCIAIFVAEVYSRENDPPVAAAVGDVLNTMYWWDRSTWHKQWRSCCCLCVYCSTCLEGAD